MSLPVSSQTETFTNHFFYTYQGKQHTLADYLSRQRVMGLMVLQGGQRWFEAYQYKRTPSMRFLGHSFAKSMTSLAIGHALQEGIFASLDIRSDTLAPVLSGSLYGEATLRQLLHMSSGVQFDDRYDGQGDTAVFSRIAAQRGIAAAAHNLRVREIADGERFAYSSAQTSVLSLVFQSVAGEDLASFVGKRLWQAMGAESEALWLQDRFGVVRASGSFCATLADYARWGAVLANNGYRPDTGQEVFSQAYLLDATDCHKHPLACQPGTATPNLGYGLHFWTFPGHPRRFMLMGVYGQFMFVAPDLQLVMVQLGAGADAKNADTLMAQEALAMWRGLLDSPILRVNQSNT